MTYGPIVSVKTKVAIGALTAGLSIVLTPTIHADTLHGEPLCKSAAGAEDIVPHVGAGVKGTLAGHQQDQEADEDLSRTDKRMKKRRERINKNFEATGETTECLPTVRPSMGSTILSENKIFYDNHNDGYMVTLSDGCDQLPVQQQFRLDVFGGRVCTPQIIDVIGPLGQAMGSCTFQEIEVYERRDDDD